jgi:protein-disulfide isomerase
MKRLILVVLGLTLVLTAFPQIIIHAQDGGATCPLAEADCAMIAGALTHTSTLQSVNVDTMTFDGTLTQGEGKTYIAFTATGPIVFTGETDTPYNLDFLLLETKTQSDTEEPEILSGNMIRLLNNSIYTYTAETDSWNATASPSDNMIFLLGAFVWGAPYNFLETISANPGVAVWSRGEDAEVNGETVAVFNFDVRVAEWMKSPAFQEDLGVYFMQLGARQEDLPGMLQGITAVAEQFSENSFHVTLQIAQDDFALVGFSTDLAFGFPDATLATVLGGETAEGNPTYNVQVTTSATLSQHNEPFEIVAPEGVAAVEPVDPSMIRFNGLADESFALYQGIPVAGGDGTHAEDVAEGVVKGMLETGIPYLGNPAAPIHIAEFADFSCPHCREFEPFMDSLIANYVRSGLLYIEFYPLTFVGDELSAIAASGAVCAGKQGAFWEFHHALFAIQYVEGAYAFDAERMNIVAEDLGLDMTAFTECYVSDLPTTAIDTAYNLQEELGVTGTPTLVYRTPDNPVWQRFVDTENNPIGIPDGDELYTFIESFRTE